jgi:hypothetical protein
MLKISIEKLAHTGIFGEYFDKEENQIVVKYTPFRAGADKFDLFDWPNEEEYAKWKTIYVDPLDI